MSETIRAIQYGLGPIGNRVARHVFQRSGVTLVGGVDTDPGKAGRDVGEVIGLDHRLGMQVMPDLSGIVEENEADVVLHTTSSYFHLFKPQIVEILEAGLDVVSTAEELSFPWQADPAGAEEIDALARRVSKTVLGTGVNPGFLMDSLPLYLTSICQEVNHIEVTRIINASTRRGPFQLKIGAGMTVEDFEARMAVGEMGHVGLTESMAMVFDTLGRELLRIEEEVEPILARARLETDHVLVVPGQVQGLRQVARGYTDEGELLRLNFIAALEVEDEGDTIRIMGHPDLSVTLEGTNGDIATAAVVVNAIPRVLAAPPGLVTMRDLPIVTHW